MNETFDYIIRFVSFIETKNKFDEIERELKINPVFADMQELSQFEYNQAATEGLKPEIKFVISEYLEYNGESIIEFESKYYKVLRTKRTKNGRGLSFICQSTINPWEVDSDANAEIGS